MLIIQITWTKRMPINIHAAVQQLLDMHSSEALNVALHKSGDFLEADNLAAAAAMARVAALISEID